MTLPERPLGRLPRWAALIVLALTILACGWSIPATQSIEQGAFRNHGAISGERPRDMDLYRAVNARVADGEDYYSAAISEHHANGYPARPFFAVRMPTLAWGTALWGSHGWQVIAALLWAANIAAWWLLAAGTSRWKGAAAAAAAAFYGAIALMPDVAVYHDLLAGLLVSLSFALRGLRTIVPSLGLAVAAILIRELAALYLLAWAVSAMLERDWRQFRSLSVGMLVGFAAITAHALAVIGSRPTDALASPGWSGFEGPALALYGLHITSLLSALPAWAAGPLAVLPLLGWLGTGGRTGTLSYLWFGGFILAVCVFARADNFYWLGLLVPAYGIGLAFVPRAVAQLLSRVAHR